MGRLAVGPHSTPAQQIPLAFTQTPQTPQRDAHDVESSRRCNATSSTLTTRTPISCSTSWRCLPQDAMRSVTAYKPRTRAVCSETGSPHAINARYASCSVLGLNPSAWPGPWQVIRSLRRAVTPGFFCRSERAALWGDWRTAPCRGFGYCALAAGRTMISFTSISAG
jgi:hypothetical protein